MLSINAILYNTCHLLNLCFIKEAFKEQNFNHYEIPKLQLLNQEMIYGLKIIIIHEMFLDILFESCLDTNQCSSFRFKVDYFMRLVEVSQPHKTYLLADLTGLDLV